MFSTEAMIADQPGQTFYRKKINLDELQADQVLIRVRSTGLCRSDLNMWKNDWKISKFPLVLGHEVVGEVVQAGVLVRSLKIGDHVGVGWNSGSCGVCNSCRSHTENYCEELEQTIVGRAGGLAGLLKCKAEWAIKIPEGLEPDRVGPLFCAGITVFTPIYELGIRPTDRVCVLGAGGLGHLAIKFLNKWGCEVTTLTSHSEKKSDLQKCGAHRVLSTHDNSALKLFQNYFNFILITTCGSIEFNSLLKTLTTNGRIHFVGGVPDSLSFKGFEVMAYQRSVSGSITGNPKNTANMLDFCKRHQILPEVEFMKFSEVELALKKLENGETKFRIVLKNDLG